jgi:hypothetical protein
MSSVLFARGVNSQANNPLRVEITRVIALSTALERRIVALERELADVKSRSANVVPGPMGPRGERGEKGDKGDRGEKGEKGDSS